MAEKKSHWLAKHKVLTGVLGVVILIITISIIGNIGGAGQSFRQGWNEGTTTKKEEPKTEGAKVAETEKNKITDPYSIKDVKANEKNFSASVHMPTITNELVIKVVKDIKDSNYTANMNSFEIFIFSDEDIAKKYLKVTDEESVAFDKEMKGWYVKMNNPESETLEILGKYQDVKQLKL